MNILGVEQFKRCKISQIVSILGVQHSSLNILGRHVCMRKLCSKYSKCLRLKHIRSSCKLHKNNLYTVQCISRVDIFLKKCHRKEKYFLITSNV